MRASGSTLALCVVGGLQASLLERRGKLRELLPGNLEHDVIEVYVQDADAFDVDSYARQPTYALSPSITLPFPRTRWLSSLESFSEFTLIASTHNIGQPLLRWLDSRVAARADSPSQGLLQMLAGHRIPLPTARSAVVWHFSDGEGDGPQSKQIAATDAAIGGAKKVQNPSGLCGKCSL